MKEHYISLADGKVILEPLTSEHVQKMRALGSDQDVWRWYTEDLSNPDDLERWMTNRLSESGNGDKMSYAVILRETEKVIGASSYGHINWAEKCIEIGWTWLDKEYIGSGINRHMKFLMLHHAFETMEIERLELRTDEENIRSRKAMEKIGAKLDGTLRSHRGTQGGRRRNTVIYSIIRPEWEPIKNSIFKEF